MPYAYDGIMKHIGDIGITSDTPGPKEILGYQYQSAVILKALSAFHLAKRAAM